MKLQIIRDTIKETTGIDIFEHRRRRDVVEMRCVANKYMRNIKKMRLTEIVREYKRCGFKTHHATILHSLKNYKQNCHYNKELELMYKTLINDNRLYVMKKIPKATDKQIEQIEEILM